MAKKRDSDAHLRTEKAMRAALRKLKSANGLSCVLDSGEKYYEVSVYDSPALLRSERIAIFDLRRCISDRPALKGIKKLIGPRKRK